MSEQEIPSYLEPPAPIRREPRYRPLRSISALMLREMSTTYGRSPGGYVWAILEPVGMLVILSFAFSLLLRAPSLGNNFILFYATAFLPLRMYQDVAAKTTGTIRFSKALLAYPTVTVMDSLISRVLLAVLTNMLTMYIIYTVILLTLDTRVILDFKPMVVSLSVAILLGMGVGAVNCVLFELYPLWKSIFTMLTRPLFLFSAVLYILEDLPGYAADWLWYNPLVHVTGHMRTGFYPFYDANYVSLAYVAGLGAALFLIGALLLRRLYKDLLLL